MTSFGDERRVFFSSDVFDAALRVVVFSVGKTVQCNYVVIVGVHKSPLAGREMLRRNH